MRKVGNPLALAVLSYLTRRPMHPYELSRTLREDDAGRSFKFSHGSLYMVFGQLAKAGFITTQGTLRDGRVEMRDWLRALVEEPQPEYPHFVAALSLIAALPPDEVVELLGRRLDRLARLQAEATALVEQTVAAGEHPLFLIEEEYRAAMSAAEASFVRRLIERITDPDTGWAPAWAEVLAGFPLPPAEELEES
jgi:DNA-binding PadR family transcriptional regulator